MRLDGARTRRRENSRECHGFTGRSIRGRRVNRGRARLDGGHRTEKQREYQDRLPHRERDYVCFDSKMPAFCSMARITHASIQASERRGGVGGELVRLCVGAEDVADLIGDLEQGPELDPRVVLAWPGLRSSTTSPVLPPHRPRSWSRPGMTSITSGCRISAPDGDGSPRR
ncbi:MAG: hypothetical protein E6J28_14385 [Chloroflexi bacterium]|nr:MAG: hypothetical protein E6J28_14385 [Chloroflexota bacterium]